MLPPLSRPKKTVSLSGDGQAAVPLQFPGSTRTPQMSVPGRMAGSDCAANGHNAGGAYCSQAGSVRDSEGMSASAERHRFTPPTGFSEAPATRTCLRRGQWPKYAAVPPACQQKPD